MFCYMEKNNLESNRSLCDKSNVCYELDVCKKQTSFYINLLTWRLAYMPLHIV